MHEIDTKPIESVQVLVPLFGEKGDQRKRLSSSSSSDEMDKEKDVGSLLTDLANYKVQLEAKDSAYSQLLLKLERYQKTAEELSTLLESSEVERDVYIEELRKSKFQVGESEFKVKEMADQLSETGKVREQLSHVLNELKATQEELLSMETELAVAREAKLKALTQAELMETSANIEKERAEELLRQVADLNEVILMSKLAAVEAEKEKCMALCKKDAEVEIATEIAAQAQKQLEEMRKQLDMVQELENQLLAKSMFIDSLQLELNQANELLSSSDKAVSDAINDLNRLKTELEGKEKENSDQAFYVTALETELNQLKLELKNANDEVRCLHSDVGSVDINRENTSQAVEVSQINESKAEPEERVDETPVSIKISLEEYESLIIKAKNADQEPAKDSNQVTTQNKYEVEILKKDLEVAMAKIGEFRTRAEQAVTRAEAAEKAKLTLEDQIQKLREQKQRRKAALAALREESSSSRGFSTTTYDTPPRTYQPLGKVLNMKF